MCEIVGKGLGKTPPKPGLVILAVLPHLWQTGFYAVGKWHWANHLAVDPSSAAGHFVLRCD